MEVENALRQAIWRHPQWQLEAPGQYWVELEFPEMSYQLAPYAEPSLRAAEYWTFVELTGVVGCSSSGMTTVPIHARGEGRARSPPGGVDALEGALRVGFQHAARAAARDLMTVLGRMVAQNRPVCPEH